MGWFWGWGWNHSLQCTGLSVTWKLDASPGRTIATGNNGALWLNENRALLIPLCLTSANLTLSRSRILGPLGPYWAVAIVIGAGGQGHWANVPNQTISVLMTHIGHGCSIPNPERDTINPTAMPAFGLTVPRPGNSEGFQGPGRAPPAPRRAAQLVCPQSPGLLCCHPQTWVGGTHSQTKAQASASEGNPHSTEKAPNNPNRQWSVSLPDIRAEDSQRLLGSPPLGTDGETKAQGPELMPNHSASQEHFLNQAVPTSSSEKEHWSPFLDNWYFYSKFYLRSDLFFFFKFLFFNTQVVGYEYIPNVFILTHEYIFLEKIKNKMGHCRGGTKPHLVSCLQPQFYPLRQNLGLVGIQIWF